MPAPIRFCSSADGTGIAYQVQGTGPPLVRVGTWLTHLQYDRESPLWQHWLDALAGGRTLLRYDERGSGMSDRDVTRFSVDAWVEDLEAVVDAAGLDQFSLLGLSNAAAVAVAYAVRHPERVSHLVLYGGFAQGRLRQNPTPEQRAEAEVMISLIRTGWGKSNPAFRRVFTTLFVPDATNAQMSWFDELQRISASPETAARMRLARQQVDIQNLLAQVTSRTLVLHAKDDAAAPFELGRAMAAAIANASFVPLEGRNHILLADEPAWTVFQQELNDFLPTQARSAYEPTPDGDVSDHGTLTPRQTEVLRLLARGHSNAEIAAELHISEHTVHRHIANIYRALDLGGRAAAAAFAALRGIV